MKCTDGGSDMPHSLIGWIFIVCIAGWSISKIVRASEKAGPRSTKLSSPHR
jgi:hypothetical protein